MKKNTSKEYHIAHFGAFDLFSYGDTLFPVVFEREMRERFGDEISIDLFAAKESNHPYNDLPHVYSIDQFEKMHTSNPYDALVIGGGELINFTQIQYNTINGESTNYEVGDLWEKPQKIAEKIGVPVLWNCVGVSSEFTDESEKERIRSACLNLSYISVRDVYSKQKLENSIHITNVYNISDMLWLLNKHFSRDLLKEIRKKLAKEYVFLNEKYMILQYGTSKNYETVAKNIAKIATEKKCQLVSLIINYCHEDKQITDNICKSGLAISFDRMLTPLEIMAVISGAEFFFGTSLHGNLTAMSYDVENICLDMYPTFVSKIDGMFEMLNQSYRIVNSANKLCNSYNNVIRQSSHLDTQKNIIIIQDRLKKHFDRIGDIIEGEKMERVTIDNKYNGDNRYVKAIINSAFRDEIMIFNNRIGNEESYHIDEIDSGETTITFYISGIFSIKALKVVSKGAPLTFLVDDSIYSIGKTFKDSFTLKLKSAEKIDVEILLQLENGILIENQYYIMKSEQLLHDNENYKTELIRKNAHVDYMIDKEREYQTLINSQKDDLLHKDLELNESKQYLEQKTAELNENKQCLEQVTLELNDNRQFIGNLNEQIEQLKINLKEKDNVINNKNAHIEQLLVSERNYVNIYNSKAVRLVRKWWAFKEWMFPQNSKRRFFAKIIKKFVKHPIYMLKKLTPDRIKRTAQYLKSEDVSQLENRLELATIDANEQKYCERMALDLFPVRDNICSIDDVEKLIIPYYKNPKVSIVIPVYNQIHYTYNCLKSIIQNTGDVPYEIIIADDCSTDLTKDIKLFVDNLNVEKTEINMRFLKNCNNAARNAKGEYILFLNNDTQVQKNWLKPLVDLIERDSTIGMVGSKLVYSDGRLQEAGGILWKDGSAWNYGHLQDPSASEFDYVKEVDYISGASIMIRSSLWKEIGGFDEFFAPAYCEDSDLAFEVRKHGYKVMYQPLSVVVHFEGVSNGTDTSSGQKAYQIVNQKKFVQKWGELLNKEHYPNAENVFIARDRSRNKPVILFIDHYVPQYDKDAGSRTVFQYVKLFVNQGFNVKFIGDNFYRHEPYTTALQQMGVEVLYGPYYANNWKKWIQENGQFIKYAFLNRPHIAVKYIDFIREHTNAKIIYYGHDLHFLREKRQYEITGDEKTLKNSDEWKQKEFSLMKKSDVTYYPSIVEVNEIHSIDSSINVKAIVPYFFDDLKVKDYIMDERKDIMFIGGFGHTPNVDAVLWIANEIMPIVWESIPEMRLFVLGSNPTDEIKELNSEKIVVKGYVSDDELDAFYNKTRISVVPLRYGAGIKGKIIEAMKNGIPCITTDVGAEGIIGSENVLGIANTTEDLAHLIISLYNDETTLSEMSKKSYEYIEKNYTSINALKTIAKDFDIVLE